jgi:signal transduction histidine kinase
MRKTSARASLAGDFVSLCVEDCGTGMSDDVLAHIFEPFFTTKEVGKGSGLGLPQVYGFAQQSGGAVKVETILGRGTKMILLLPRTAAPASTARDAGGRPGLNRAPTRAAGICLARGGRR